MPELCLSTNLSSADAASWASFCATLFGAIGTLLAVYAAFVVARRQERVAERNRRHDARDAKLRSLAILRQATKQMIDALEMLGRLARGEIQIPTSVLEGEAVTAAAMFDFCLRGAIPVESISDVWDARQCAQMAINWIREGESAINDMNSAILAINTRKLQNILEKVVSQSEGLAPDSA